MNQAADSLRKAASRRILIKDGAYGTEIQRRKLVEADYRGDLDLARDQKGNNDLLNVTRPAIVEDICRSFADAGAEILATNTFNANRISLADYGAEHLVGEINRAAVANTRKVADESEGDRWVAGAIGPTNKTLSISPDVTDPGYREVDFDQMVGVYAEQIEALAEGGVDFLLIETVFDTLNAKAAIMAAGRTAPDIPLMLSMTITDMAGRNLSGHSIEAFWASVRHARPVTIGLNCSFGADRLRPALAELSNIADTLVMAYPNAGLPNELGEYDQCPETTAEQVATWLDQGIVNIVGGCCGTTPEHIAAMAEIAEGAEPREIPARSTETFLAGLEPMTIAA
ncbi:MAG: homocysteine S-methyltransferase family protein [Sphingomonadales bacterium]|nr:homocysteine S-methyltransferase family protein [Sphingomonadales bacterium]